MKTPLIQFVFQNLSLTIDLTLRAQAVDNSVRLLLEFDLGGRMGEAKLHVKIKLDWVYNTFMIFLNAFFC